MNSLRLLIIEDDKDICSILKLALEKENFKVEVAYSGVSALEKLQSYTPDMILLDVMMPEMDGLTVLKKIRKVPALKNIPVVFVTAKVQQEEINSYLKAGAFEVVKKPFDPLKFPAIIQSLWNKFKGKN